MSKAAWIIVIVLVLAVIAALVVPMALAPMHGGVYGYGYGGMMGPWMMGGYGVWGVILSIVFVVLVVAGAVWLFQSVGRTTGGSTPPGGEAPLDILKRRYANGEITKKQFDDMKKDLGL